MLNEQKSTKRMPRRWQEVLTTITTALFLVIAVTGVMLLVGVGKGTVKGAHEWLGLVFTLAAVAHGVYHWRPIAAYARRPVLWVATAAVLLATLAFVAPSQTGRSGDPTRTMFETIGAAPLERVALLINVDASEVEARLRTAGIEFADVHQTLREIERSSGKRLPELLAIIAPR